MWVPEIPHPHNNTNIYASLQIDDNFSPIDGEEIFKRMLIVYSTHTLLLSSLTWNWHIVYIAHQ